MSKCLDCRTEYLVSPLGMDERNPRFCWRLDRGSQSAYELELEGLGSTGKVRSGESLQITFPGIKLQKQTLYRWRVRVWDEADSEGEWSNWNSFETGLFGDFPGPWLRSSVCGTDSQPCAMFRASFTLPGKVKKARIYATALGLYLPSINGEAVSAHHFLPGWTDYYHRVQYQTFDVTGLLNEGENVLGIILNEGWFSGKTSRQWTLGKVMYGDTPAFKLILECDNNRIPLDWSYTVNGPVRASDMYLGENYDARMELPGWDRPGFIPDARWFPAMTMEFPIRYDWTAVPCVISGDVIPPVGERKHGNQRIFDFGINHAGRERVVFRHVPRGREIIFRHGEMPDNDGSVYFESNRGARAASVYIAKGEEKECFEPHFTYFGFRYLAVEGADDLELEIVSVKLHSPIERTGDFHCSSELVNQLYRNVWNGQLANYVDVPTDCPQRDERLGWTADTQIFAGTAACNADVAAFFTKYLTDLELCCNEHGGCPQFVPFYRKNDFLVTAGWADAKLICPEVLYLHYNDRRVLEKSYPSTVKYLHWTYENECVDGITANARFRDHMAVEQSSPEMVATAFFANALRIGMQMAQILNDPAEKAALGKLYEKTVSAWRRRFVNKDGTLRENTQGALVLALQFNLAEAGKRAAAVHQLAGNIRDHRFHLTTGFLTTGFLLPVLLHEGLTEEAYGILEQTTSPSWLFPVTQGATSIWERWNAWTLEKGFDKGDKDSYGCSFNHYAFGAVAESFFRDVCGILPDAENPGFKHFFLFPHPGGSLTEASAHYDSMYGRIEASWKKQDGHYSYTFTVPPNTTATLLPEGKTFSPGRWTVER